MSETRTSAIAITAEASRRAEFLNLYDSLFSRAGVWATDTAQEFGAVVAALMGPAIFSAYAVAAWSLSSNLGWTDTFLFSTGPLSNWLVWMSLAILVNLAATVLRRHANQTTRP